MMAEPFNAFTNRSKQERIHINEEFLYSDLIKSSKDKKLTE